MGPWLIRDEELDCWSMLYMKMEIGICIFYNYWQRQRQYVKYSDEDSCFHVPPYGVDWNVRT